MGCLTSQGSVCGLLGIAKSFHIFLLRFLCTSDELLDWGEARFSLRALLCSIRVLNHFLINPPSFSCSQKWMKRNGNLVTVHFLTKLYNRWSFEIINFAAKKFVYFDFFNLKLSWPSYIVKKKIHSEIVFPKICIECLINSC